MKVLKTPLRAYANAKGISEEGYVRTMLERDLAASLEKPYIPFKTGQGVFAKYGAAPIAQEIDANRADMFQRFGEDL